MLSDPGLNHGEKVGSEKQVLGLGAVEVGAADRGGRDRGNHTHKLNHVHVPNQSHPRPPNAWFHTQSREDVLDGALQETKTNTAHRSSGS